MNQKYSQNGFTVIQVSVGIVILVVVIVGSLLLYIDFKRGGGIKLSATPTPMGPQRTADKSTPTIFFKSQNGSNLDAQYKITAIGSKSGISSQTGIHLIILNEPSGVVMPAHIHTGSCANIGAVKYPLTSVANGRSDTVIDISLLELKFGLPLAINIHKSTKEPGVNVACADLNVDGSVDALLNK